MIRKSGLIRLMSLVMLLALLITAFPAGVLAGDITDSAIPGLKVSFERVRESPISVDFRVVISSTEELANLPLKIDIDPLGNNGKVIIPALITIKEETLETVLVDTPVYENVKMTYTSVHGIYKNVYGEVTEPGTEPALISFVDLDKDEKTPLKEVSLFSDIISSLVFVEKDLTWTWNENTQTGTEKVPTIVKVETLFDERVGADKAGSSLLSVDTKQDKGHGSGVRIFNITIRNPLTIADDGWGSSGVMVWLINGIKYFDRVNSSWWSNSWKYRKSLSFSRPSGAVTNYQIPLEVGESTGTVYTVSSTTLFTGFASTFTALGGYDDFDWTSPTNIYADDATDASITDAAFDSGKISYVLRAKTFGFTIPLSAVIKGIYVIVGKYHANGDVVDALARLTKDGTAGVGLDQQDNVNHWPDADSATGIGGSTDLWNTTWTATEINASTFGLLFAAKAHADDADAFIDYITIKVYYTAGIDCNAKCQTDFDDIRFTAASDTVVLDYWIESITGTTPNQKATIWVEFDSIGTGATTFYLYYGYASATAVSSGANTFSKFDDFERGADGDAIGGNWTVSAGTPTISTTQAYSGSRSGKFKGGATPDSAYLLNTMVEGRSLYVRLWKAAATTQYNIWWQSATYSVIITIYTDGSVIYYDGADHDTGSNITNDAWNLIEIRNVNLTANTYDIYLNGSSIKTGATMYNGASVIINSYVTDSNATHFVYIDNIVVRQLLATEPAWGSWGAEMAPSITSSGIGMVIMGRMSPNETYTTGLTAFTITNNGNCVVDITISGTDMTGGVTLTLSDTCTIGANTYGLKAGIEGGDYTIIVKKTATYNGLVSSLAVNASQRFGLKFYTPSSFTDAVAKTGTVSCNVIVP
jgi:hypothetical protein